MVLISLFLADWQLSWSLNKSKSKWIAVDEGQEELGDDEERQSKKKNSLSDILFQENHLLCY